MARIEDEHIAAMLADKKLLELPSVLTDAIGRVPNAGILKGLKKIDGAVDQANLECEDLGHRLLARIFRHFAKSGDNQYWDRDSRQSYYIYLAGVSWAALRYFMKRGKPAEVCAHARVGLAVGLGSLAELSENREEARELLASAIEFGEASVDGFWKVGNSEQWFRAYRVLLIAHLQLFQNLESISEKIGQLERSSDLAENAVRLGQENQTSRNLAVLKTFLATSYRELSRYVDDDTDAEILLVQAIDIQDDALDFLDRKADRSEWVEAQENSGNLRMFLREVLDDGKARRCVTAAGKAYKAALGGISMFKEPQRWSRVNFNLGSTYRAEAGLTLKEADAARLLRHSISAYRKAASIIRRETFPEDFPRLAYELADAHFELAQLKKGRKSRKLLQRSIEIFEFESRDFDCGRDPNRWLSYKMGLSRSLRHLGERSSSDDLAMGYYHRSVKNAEEALHVIDEAGHDLMKASVREFLGCVYFAMSRHASDEDSADELLVKSIESFDAGVRNCRGEASDSRDEMKNMAVLLRRFRENKADEGLVDAASKLMGVMKPH